MEAKKVIGFLDRGSGKLPKKKSFSLKLSGIVKKSIHIAKMSTKPIIPRLILLKKSPHNRRLIKKFKLGMKVTADQYNYRFLRQYEFSPSRAPLIRFNMKEYSNVGSLGSMLFFCGCWGRMKGGGEPDRVGDEGVDFEEPAIEDGFGGMKKFLQPLEPIRDDGDDSVDRRAEWFIAKFYQEMRMQRQDSF